MTSAGPVIEVSVEHGFGAFRLDASFVSSGRLTALVGRSGAGKTSLVNVVAGLVRPRRGRVVVEGEVLLDTGSGRFVPAHRRRIGYVFQDARLFPHLNVRQNLLYGRWFAARGTSAGGDLAGVLDLLDIGHLLERRPAGLSGGERQRVAIGRALLSKPRLLLMDEPLASLDEARKAEIMPYLERLRDEARMPIVYVSHAMAEVVRLAGTLVMLDRGRVAASGPTAQLLARPGLAGLAGAQEAGSMIEARVLSHDDRYDLTALETRAGRLLVPRCRLQPGASARIRILASDVLVCLDAPAGVSALNILPGIVSEIGARRPGGVVEMLIDCGGEPVLARLTQKSVDTLGLSPGKHVHAVVKSVSIDAP